MPFYSGACMISRIGYRPRIMCSAIIVGCKYVCLFVWGANVE
jgi:hypothetical protein